MPAAFSSGNRRRAAIIRHLGELVYGGVTQTVFCIKVPTSGEKDENEEREDGAESQTKSGEENIEEGEKAEPHLEQPDKGLYIVPIGYNGTKKKIPASQKILNLNTIQVSGFENCGSADFFWYTQTQKYPDFFAYFYSYESKGIKNCVLL